MEYTHRLQEELLDKLEQIIESADVIAERIKGNNDIDVLMQTPWGMTTLDACIMRLQVIGELIRVIDIKTEGNLFIQYPSIPWKQVIGMRNFISHEYANIDYDMIWVVLKKHLPMLKSEVEKIKHNIIKH